MKVATWNVLHRIHAVNWSEPAIRAHADEAARTAAIAARVASLADVVCLQEVSGDQLAALRAEGLTVLDHRYPRVPRLRSGEPLLADPTEYLVTVTAHPVRESHSHTFDDDRGKGFLVVELASGVVVINTHVSYGTHHAAQCSVLAREAAAHAQVVLVGDFNADRATCGERLGPSFTIAEPAQPAIATRPRTDGSGKSQDIDHVFVKGLAIESAAVIDGRGLSDHNPVVAILR